MQNFDENSIIEQIEILRNSYGWSYYQLAKRADLPLSTLRNILKLSHIPSIFTLHKIVGAFQLTLSDFFLYLNTSPSDSAIDSTIVQKIFDSLDDRSKELVLIYMKGLAKLPIDIKNENL